MRTHLVCGMLLIIFVSLSLGALPALADQIQIHVTGLNFKYDGSDIYDSSPKPAAITIRPRRIRLQPSIFSKIASTWEV